MSVAVRIGTLYVISGVGGSLLSSLFMVSNISVGASGALFGLLGSMLSELITNWTIYENKVDSKNICSIFTNHSIFHVSNSILVSKKISSQHS